MSVSELKLFTYFPIDVPALDVYVSIYIISIMDLAINHRLIYFVALLSRQLIVVQKNRTGAR